MKNSLRALGKELCNMHGLFIFLFWYSWRPCNINVCVCILRNYHFLWLIIVLVFTYFKAHFLLWLDILQLSITLKKEDIDPEKIQFNEYYYAGGLVEYVKWLNTDKVCFHIFLCFSFFFDLRFGCASFFPSNCICHKCI